MARIREHRRVQVDRLDRRAAIDHELEVLAAVPAFAGCSRSDLEQVRLLATEVRCRAGVEVQGAGRRPRQVVVLLDGTMVERTASGSRVLGPSAVVGIQALQQPGTTATASVVTQTAIRALVLGPVEVLAVAALLEGSEARSAAAPEVVPAGAAARVRRRAAFGFTGLVPAT